MKRNELKTGAVLSYVNLLIGNLIPFIYTPIMLRVLGTEEFGLYGIANSVMGYLGLLNFGIGGSIVRYISKYRAINDTEQERRVAGLFIKVYSVICGLILVVGGLFVTNIEIYSRSLTPLETEKLRILVILMTVNTGVFLPFSVFSAIVLAHEKYVFDKLVNILITVGSPILNLILLYCGWGSVGLVLGSTLINLLSYSLYTYYTIKRLHFMPSFQPAAPGLLREIIHFSAFIFLASIVDVLYWSTDKLIIGWAKGTSETAVYNIGATFNTYVTAFSTALGGLLIPKLTTMVVKDVPKEEFSRIFIKVGRLQFIIVSFIVSAFVAFGRQFINLWAGPEYSRSYYVALLTMIPVTVPLIQNTGLNILYALNRHRFRSIIYACVAIVNVALTFWWVEEYGIIGAAMATCIAYVIGNIFIINWYYYTKIGIDIPLFWNNILKMCPVMIVMGVCAWVALSYISITNWFIFFAAAAIYTVIYFLLAYRFMMNAYEREFVKSFVMSLRAKLR